MRNVNIVTNLTAADPNNGSEDKPEPQTSSYLPAVGVTLLVLDLTAVFVNLLMLE